MSFLFSAGEVQAVPGSVGVDGNVNYCYTLIAVGVESWYRCGNITYSWPGMPEGQWDLQIDLGSVPGWRFVSVNPSGAQSNVNRSFSWYSTWEQIPAPPPVPSVSISADSTNLSYGGSTTIHWSVSPSGDSRISCTAGGTKDSWQGNIGNTGYSSGTGPLYQTHTYSVTCSSSSGSNSASVTVNVEGPPQVSVSLSANPTNVFYNGTTTLSWSSNNASSCSAGGSHPSWQGSISTSGSSTSPPLTSSQTYTVTCSNQYNSDSRSVFVTVNQPSPPSVSVSVSPSTVKQGENVTVTWSVSGNVSSCTATGNWPGWQGSIGTSGYSSTTQGGLTENPTTFGVSCTGPGGTGSDSKSVTVIKRYTLNVTKSGTGSGTVTGSGISCGTDCSETYDAGSCIEYFHSETKGSKWGGWSGACTGPGCIICYDGNKSLTATFLKNEPTASITCSPGTVLYNSSANVSWSSQNTSNCTVSPTGWTGKSGSKSTGNLTSSQTYTVTCTSSSNDD